MPASSGEKVTSRLRALAWQQRRRDGRCWHRRISHWVSECPCRVRCVCYTGRRRGETVVRRAVSAVVSSVASFACGAVGCAHRQAASAVSLRITRHIIMHIISYRRGRILTRSHYDFSCFKLPRIHDRPEHVSQKLSCRHEAQAVEGCTRVCRLHRHPRRPRDRVKRRQTVVAGPMRHPCTVGRRGSGPGRGRMQGVYRESEEDGRAARRTRRRDSTARRRAAPDTAPSARRRDRRQRTTTALYAHSTNGARDSVHTRRASRQRTVTSSSSSSTTTTYL